MAGVGARSIEIKGPDAGDSRDVSSGELDSRSISSGEDGEVERDSIELDISRFTLICRGGPSSFDCRS